MLFLYLQTPLLVQVALLDFVTHQSSRTPYFTQTILFAFFALKVLVTSVSLFHAQVHAPFFFANFPTTCFCKIAPEIKSEVKIEKGNQDSAARSIVSRNQFFFCNCNYPNQNPKESRALFEYAVHMDAGRHGICQKFYTPRFSG